MGHGLWPFTGLGSSFVYLWQPGSSLLFSPPASDATNSQSEPLDEDLFSDLTLQVPTPSLTLSPSPSPSEPCTPATSTTPTPSPLRQVSHKKKRVIRVGYARDAVSIDDELHLPSSSTAFSSSAPLPPVFSQEVTAPPLPPTEPKEISSTYSSSNLAVQSRDTSQSEREIEQHEEPSAVVNQEQGNKEEESLVETTSRSEFDNDKVAVENEGCDSIEQKLAVVRAKILKKAELATQRAVSIMAKRKELAYIKEKKCRGGAELNHRG
ncbi:hypothetical protein FCM35_KLT06030 [Carex littledalei]|uniref:Uncharacterized protein n=1 Tax=Carex littledalei TaxID=544730 RepID=A0A833QYP7_9POAL|nr:hypothetical protein FCM35_KLT06030 [Carex littledalei]